jgi:carboxyl-terminal processing protease
LPYLTPGDLSIQEVGITPDIQLIPTRVAKDRVDVFAPRKSMGEADLEHHFSNPANAQAARKRDDVVVREKPADSLKYLKEERVAKADAKDGKDGKDAAKEKAHGPRNSLTDSDGAPEEELDDQLDAEAQDEVKEDFEVSFARDFIVAAPAVRRDEMLKMGRSFVAEKRQVEEKRIADAITGLGIDWAAGPTRGTCSSPATSSPATTEDHRRRVGPARAHHREQGNRRGPRLRAWIESENGFLDRRGYLRALKPGEKKSWSVSVKTTKDLASRRDGVTVKLQDDNGLLQETIAGELNFVELPRPQFAYGWSLVDTCGTCNGDGLAQRGEDLTLMVDVTNVGSGKALDAFASFATPPMPASSSRRATSAGELAVGRPNQPSSSSK